MGVVKRPIGGPLVATIPMGDHVSDIVTNPRNCVAYAALRGSVAVISSRYEVSCVIPIGADARDLTIATDGSRLYATNYGDSVSVIDISDHRVRVIPGARRVQQVDTPDGALIYAAGNFTRGCWMSAIDEGGTAVAAIDGFGGDAVTDLAADSDGYRVYAGLCRGSAYRQYDAGALGVVDTTTSTAIHTIDLVGSPDSITLSPDGSMMYATHPDLLCVSAVDLASFRVTRIELGDSPLEVRFTPDGLQAFATSRRSLSAIDTVTGEAERIAVGDLPRCVRISPDGKYAYVSNFGDRSVSVVDTVARCVTDTIDVGGDPEAMALSPDGERLYVGDYWSGTVTVLSVQP